MLKQGIPVHEQISNWIRNQIKSGNYEVDEKLPSEMELTKKFGVSRVTVRRALQTLENEQLIYRRQGLGSFVREDRPRQSFAPLTDFAEDMRRAGMSAHSMVVSMEHTGVSEQISTQLDIGEDKTVIRLDRLRLGDGEPVAFDVTWLPLFYGQLIEGYDLTDETIYRILEEDFDIPMEKGQYRIEAANADDYLAEHLQVDEEKALLLMDRLSLTVGRKPIYYQKRYYRTDQIVYELSVERNPDDKTAPGNRPLREFLPVCNRKGK